MAAKKKQSESLPTENKESSDQMTAEPKGIIKSQTEKMKGERKPEPKSPKKQERQSKKRQEKESEKSLPHGEVKSLKRTTLWIS